MLGAFVPGGPAPGAWGTGVVAPGAWVTGVVAPRVAPRRFAGAFGPPACRRSGSGTGVSTARSSGKRTLPTPTPEASITCDDRGESGRIAEFARAKRDPEVLKEFHAE
jgi:hypothetical protein